MPYAKTGEKITAIRSLKGGKFRIVCGNNIYLLNVNDYTELRPYIGKVLSKEEEKIYSRLTKEGNVFLFGERLVNRVNLPPKKVYERILKKAEGNKNLTLRVMSFLREKGYLNEETYAKSYVEERLMLKEGPRKIKEDLRHKGIKEETLDRIPIEEKERNIREYLPLLERKFSMLPKVERERKASEFLYRKGFSSSLALKIASEIRENREDLQRYLHNRYILLRKKYELHYNEEEARERTYLVLIHTGYSSSMVKKEEYLYGKNL